MLTSDLVRLTRKAGRVRPRFLSAKDRPRLLPIAEAILATFEASPGSTRGELDAALLELPCPARDRLVIQGLKKLCDDRTELEQSSGLDPEEVRRVVFELSATAHRSAERGGYQREAVMALAAAALGSSPADLDAALFSDLKDAQIVTRFDPLTAPELLARYDVALAQAVLFRATRVVVTFSGEKPARVRNLFRAARFHGLIHTVESASKGAWKLTLDGPFSLFDAVQRYGVKLAMFLPSVLALSHWELTAELLLGAERARAELSLSPADGLQGDRVIDGSLRPELEALLVSFDKLGSGWKAARSDVVIAVPGEPAVIADLAFVNQTTGEEVLLEMFGFWSRDAVWRRVEQIERGHLPARLLLAVSKKLRVSEEVLGDETGSSIIVFGTTLSAKEVLARLDAPAARIV